MENSGSQVIAVGLASYDKILAVAELQKQHHDAVVNGCILCSCAEGSVRHMLTQCAFAGRLSVSILIFWVIRVMPRNGE